MRKAKYWLICCIAAVSVAGSFLLAYLFRIEELDNPDLGVIQLRYRWGFAHETLADTNRDGSFDFRALFDGTSRSFGSHDLPIEVWEDRNHDGVFEIHALLDGDIVERVELDHDQDGRPDQVLTGSEAAQYFKSFLGSERK